MNIQQIKYNVTKGKVVHYQTDDYVVKKVKQRWCIVHSETEASIPLTWSDGVTLVGDEQDFYIEQTELERLRTTLASVAHVLQSLVPLVQESASITNNRQQDVADQLVDLGVCIKNCLDNTRNK